jgi:hypothetical protein
VEVGDKRHVSGLKEVQNIKERRARIKLAWMRKLREKVESHL